MSDVDQDPNEIDSLRSELALPDELPPVEPPSAGMIVQLFLIPAVIVGVIVGVYVLFGRIASQELNWRQLVTDVRSENPHVRWRGALGLAQMLDADAHRSADGQHLASNEEIASALSELYGDLIKASNPSEEQIKQIEFLSKALGRMATPDSVLPVFQDGIAVDRDHEIRKHSLIGLAMHLGTLREAGTLEVPANLIDELIDISREQISILRHQTAYIFGLIDNPRSNERLEVLLEDPDQMVRVNAAIGFARNDSTLGVDVFQSLFREAVEWRLDPTQVETEPEEEEYFERMLMLLNSVKAVRQLAPKLATEERAQLANDLEELAASTEDRVLRADALATVNELN